MNDIVNVVTNLTKVVEEMSTHMTDGQDAMSQVIQELLEQKDREKKLSEAVRELFTVNDQVSTLLSFLLQLTHENENYKKEIAELRNVLKEYV